MASSSEVTHSKRQHVKTERMQEFIKAQDESNSPTKKLKCPELNCNKVFTSSPGLKYHLHTHTVKQPQFSCRKCLKVFKSANGLKYHREKTRCDSSDIEEPYIEDTFQTHNEILDQQHGENMVSPSRHKPDNLDLGLNTVASRGMDKLTELAIIATGPQSPLLQKPKPPWERKPSNDVKRSLEKMLDSCENGHYMSTSSQGSSKLTDLKSPINQPSSNERVHDGSDPRVSTSSPLCVSPDGESDRLETSNWSHTWPTAVWQCFIKGTKIRFLFPGDSKWQLAEMIAQKEELTQQASQKITASKFAPNGLRIAEITEGSKDSDQSEITIHFTPAVLGQHDISAVCQRDHPFFVKEKGWSSCNPFETVMHYGIPCCELAVGDLCLPPSHPEAAFSEDIFRSFEEFDFTPEDTSAVFALSSMKQHKKEADISPPAGSCVVSVPPGMKDEALAKVKRPMNAFLLFAKEFRVDYTNKFPRRDNRAISVMLGEQWQALSADKKRVYEEKARWLAEKQKKIYPDCWKRKKQN